MKMILKTGKVSSRSVFKARKVMFVTGLICESRSRIPLKRGCRHYLCLKSTNFLYSLTLPLFASKEPPGLRPVSRLHDNGTNGRAIGLLEGSAHWQGTTKYMKGFLLKDVVAQQIRDHGFMMSRSKHEHAIGLPHRRQELSHPADFEMHLMGRFFPS